MWLVRVGGGGARAERVVVDRPTDVGVCVVGVLVVRAHTDK